MVILYLVAYLYTSTVVLIRRESGSHNTFIENKYLDRLVILDKFTI